MTRALEQRLRELKAVNLYNLPKPRSGEMAALVWDAQGAVIRAWQQVELALDQERARLRRRK